MKKKEQYFKEVFEMAKDKIYRLCLGFMGNEVDADDLFQEVFIKVWNNLDQFRDDSNINTWIFRIATNTALFQLKKNRQALQKKQGLKIENPIESPAPEVNSEYEENIKRLYLAIASLKEIDRIIMSLLLEDCSYNDIAKITGLNVSNVGVRINRVKKILAKQMK